MRLGGSAGPSVGDTWEAALKLYSIRFLAILDLFIYFFNGFSEIRHYANSYLLLRDHSKTAHRGQGSKVKVMGTYYLTQLQTD